MSQTERTSARLPLNVFAASLFCVGSSHVLCGNICVFLFGCAPIYWLQSAVICCPVFECCHSRGVEWRRTPSRHFIKKNVNIWIVTFPPTWRAAVVLQVKDCCYPAIGNPSVCLIMEHWFDMSVSVCVCLTSRAFLIILLSKSGHGVTCSGVFLCVLDIRAGRRVQFNPERFVSL